MTCDCGGPIDHSFHHLGCVDCGQPCCPSCAIAIESATYCRDCARELLGAAKVRAGSRFELGG
jgi:hypothetical protein